MVASLVLAVSCSREPAQTWMLGVFSSADPGPSMYGGVERYYVYPAGELEYRSDFNGPGVTVIARTWVQDGRDSIVIFPGPDDTPLTQEKDEWTITRTDDCDLFDYRTIRRGKPISDEPGTVYRGEVCVRGAVGRCNGCDPYEHYWCDQPPPPCDADGGDD